MFDGFDFVGITRAIDQAIYMMLNTIATMLWRLDAALVSMSLYAYSTQDWLTGSGGGVWWILDWLIVNPGLFGVNTWTLFAGLALMLWGLSRIARPFINTSPVHPGKLLLFFLLSYVVISQGSELMQGIEAWRMEVGSTVYEAVSGSGDTSGISVPPVPSTSDPLGTPADLDGSGVIRGWEAVASTYFLVSDMDELHQSYPPQNFRTVYCLYNPELPISGQDVTNAEGCSPRVAWDEWETVDIQILQELLGLDIDAVTDPVEEFFDWFGITLEIGGNIASIPVTQHHPENRELAIRQSAAGISRLGLGIIVALFPLIEANIALMLALAASFVYISLPIVILFGFFLPTESMVTNLLMQFVNVVIRTIVIMGIVAVFMLILMDSALSGSLMSYLGLIGVGLAGGWFLQRMAAATMKEAMSGAMGAVGGVWMGTTTGLLGQSAATTASTALGAAKIAGAGAVLAGAGAMRMLDLSEATYEGVRAGEQDIRRGAGGSMRHLDQMAGKMHPALAKMAAEGLNGQKEESLLVDRAATAALAVVGLAGALQAGTKYERDAGSHNVEDNKIRSAGWGMETSGPAARMRLLTANNTGDQQNVPTATRQRQTGVDGWVGQTYAAQRSQRGQKQAAQLGRDLVGEELAWKSERALSRRSQEEAAAVLLAARQAEASLGHEQLVQNGRLTIDGLQAVRAELPPETAQAFRGQQGMWDLAALTAVGVQRESSAEPNAFRQTMAQASSGWGKESPGYLVPKALGLDPVAAGVHYTALNRFARLSDAAGLSAQQRERLLVEAQAGKVSSELREEIDISLQGRDTDYSTDDIVSSALAMPTTLTGPEQVWTTPAEADIQRHRARQKATNTDQSLVERAGVGSPPTQNDNQKHGLVAPVVAKEKSGQLVPKASDVTPPPKAQHTGPDKDHQTNPEHSDQSVEEKTAGQRDKQGQTTPQRVVAVPLPSYAQTGASKEKQPVNLAQALKSPGEIAETKPETHSTDPKPASSPTPLSTAAQVTESSKAEQHTRQAQAPKSPERAAAEASLDAKGKQASPVSQPSGGGTSVPASSAPSVTQVAATSPLVNAASTAREAEKQSALGQELRSSTHSVPTDSTDDAAAVPSPQQTQFTPAIPISVSSTQVNEQLPPAQSATDEGYSPLVIDKTDSNKPQAEGQNMSGQQPALSSSSQSASKGGSTSLEPLVPAQSADDESSVEHSAPQQPVSGSAAIWPLVSNIVGEDHQTEIRLNLGQELKSMASPQDQIDLLPSVSDARPIQTVSQPNQPSLVQPSSHTPMINNVTGHESQPIFSEELKVSSIPPRQADVPQTVSEPTPVVPQPFQSSSVQSSGRNPESLPANITGNKSEIRTNLGQEMKAPVPPPIPVASPQSVSKSTLTETQPGNLNTAPMVNNITRNESQTEIRATLGQELKAHAPPPSQAASPLPGSEPTPDVPQTNQPTLERSSGHNTRPMVNTTTGNKGQAGNRRNLGEELKIPDSSPGSEPIPVTPQSNQLPAPVLPNSQSPSPQPKQPAPMNLAGGNVAARSERLQHRPNSPQAAPDDPGAQLSSSASPTQPPVNLAGDGTTVISRTQAQPDKKPASSSSATAGSSTKDNPAATK